VVSDVAGKVPSTLEPVVSDRSHNGDYSVNNPTRFTLALFCHSGSTCPGGRLSLPSSGHFIEVEENLLSVSPCKRDHFIGSLRGTANSQAGITPHD
jgi:hypothetical protein